MGAYAATFWRVAGHDVIQPPVGYEAEFIQQVREVRNPVVKTLNQQCPVAVWQFAETLGLERAVVQLPGFAVVVLNHNPRFNSVLTGQSCQFVGRDRALKARKGLADDQWFFLPVVPQELLGGHSAGQLHGSDIPCLLRGVANVRAGSEFHQFRLGGIGNVQ